MTRYLGVQLFLSVSLILLINIQTAIATNFNKDLRNIRAEINRDNLQEAIKIIKNIKISNENEQEKIDLLFGDIYLKINQISKAEEFYQKNFFTSNEDIEAMTFIGLAEVKLAQGKLNDAIKFAQQSIKLNPNKIKSKMVLAIAKTRIGENEEALKILNELYYNRKNAEVVLAISDYYIAIDDNLKAIELLEKFIKRKPNNIKVLNQLASLHLYEGNKDKAIEFKLIVYEYYKFNRNKKKQKHAKSWILSVDPKYFDKVIKVKKKEENEVNKKKKKKKEDKQKEYEDEEITNYDDQKVTPNYEEFAFAPNSNGSGFIVGEGKYVITNYHVIDGAKKISIRNGIGKVTNANVAAFSKDYDLAILELADPYPKKYSINSNDFVIPKAGEDVISIGYPGIGLTYEQPTITQGIVSKVFDDKLGIFFTTAAINSGNSGGPLFNLKGELVGVSFATLDKKEWLAKTGQIPTDMGWAIKSNMIKKVFEHKKSVSVKSVKFDKATIYEKMLPSIVLVAVLLDDKK